MDAGRRKFLKIILIGSGAFLLERVLGPLHSWLFGDSSGKNYAKTDSLKTNFEDFRIVRNNDGLSIRDIAGEEVLQIDNKA